MEKEEKVKKIFIVLIALATFVTYAYAEGDKNQKQLDGEKGQGDTRQERIVNPNNDPLQGSQLTTEQKGIIYGIYEEEKVARDVYMTLGEMYPEENTFANIQLSEQNHMDAVRNLCDKYGIDIPAEDQEVGTFTIENMQILYDESISLGSNSNLDALKVGQQIEITDIKDLGDALAEMPDDQARDIQRVLTNLIIGSNNHLEAFNNAIDREASQ